MRKLKVLTAEDRHRIEVMNREGFRPWFIAERVGVHVATIYRELKKGYTGELTAEQRPVYSAALAQDVTKRNLSRRRGESADAEVME
jgi:IS30 family transposase